MLLRQKLLLKVSLKLKAMVDIMVILTPTLRPKLQLITMLRLRQMPLLRQKKATDTTDTPTHMVVLAMVTLATLRRNEHSLQPRMAMKI
jgi:hypothetical protein